MSQTITIDRVTQVTETQEITLPAYFHYCEFNIHKYYAFLPNDKAIQVNILPGYNDHHKTAVVSLYRHCTLSNDIAQAEPCTDVAFYEAYAEALHEINAATGVTYHGLSAIVDDGKDWEQVEDEVTEFTDGRGWDNTPFGQWDEEAWKEELLTVDNEKAA